MESKILAEKMLLEIETFPSFTQNLVKSVIDSITKEVKEGKILLVDFLESEDKLFSTIADMIDISTNTGLVDPFDYPYIKKFVIRVLRPALVRCFGDDFMDDLRKIIG